MCRAGAFRGTTAARLARQTAILCQEAKMMPGHALTSPAFVVLDVLPRVPVGLQQALLAGKGSYVEGAEI